MPGLPIITGDDFVKVLSRAGFNLDHTTGSHMILRNSSGRTLYVPRHPELGRGLLRALIRDAGLSRDDFQKLL